MVVKSFLVSTVASTDVPSTSVRLSFAGEPWTRTPLVLRRSTASTTCRPATSDTFVDETFALEVVVRPVAATAGFALVAVESPDESANAGS